MYTSVILETGTLDFSSADVIATAPRRGAETVRKAPLNLRSIVISYKDLRREGSKYLLFL